MGVWIFILLGFFSLKRNPLRGYRLPVSHTARAYGLLLNRRATIPRAALCTFFFPNPPSFFSLVLHACGVSIAPLQFLAQVERCNMAFIRVARAIELNNSTRRTRRPCRSPYTLQKSCCRCLSFALRGLKSSPACRRIAVRA